MKEVENKDLKNLNGGISVWAVVGIGSLITFVSGIIDGIARPFNCRQEEKNMEKEELQEINGGTSITGTLINGITSLLKTIYEVGQGLGGALRRVSSGKSCKI